MKQQLLPSRLDPPIMFAHRGARAVAPENTIVAFERALELGATGLESDVWLTADGVPVLDHDGVVGTRWRGRRRVSTLRRDELPAHIPSITDLIEACGDDYELSLDLKDVNAADPLLEAIDAGSAGLRSRVWLCHPDLATLTDLRARHRDVRLVHSSRYQRLEGGLERHAAVLADAGVDVLNLPHREWNGGRVTMVHRFELFAFAWDLQHEHQLRPALRMGIDAVYSDHVDRMTRAMREELGRA